MYSDHINNFPDKIIRYYSLITKLFAAILFRTMVRIFLLHELPFFSHL
uniref:Uncharacterized protein n=1 Tax=Rhizophora mucronata TaxID=61149 RepID=A0A2P2NN49_RHIMU